VSRLKTFTQSLRQKPEKRLTAHAAFDSAASMLGKDAKTCVTTCDPAGRQSNSLTFELLDEQPFHSAYSISYTLGVSYLTALNRFRESWSDASSFTSDPTPVERKFTAR
jgi:hypothetical protein